MAESGVKLVDTSNFMLKQTTTNNSSFFSKLSRNDMFYIVIAGLVFIFFYTRYKKSNNVVNHDVNNIFPEKPSIPKRVEYDNVEKKQQKKKEIPHVLKEFYSKTQKAPIVLKPQPYIL